MHRVQSPAHGPVGRPWRPDAGRRVFGGVRSTPKCTSTRPHGGSHRCGVGLRFVRTDGWGYPAGPLKPVRPRRSSVRFPASAWPPSSPTITASAPVTCRSNPPEKKSDEVPAAYYRLREFPAKIRLWTSVANGHRGSNVCCQGQSGRTGDVVGESRSQRGAPESSDSRTGTSARVLDRKGDY